MKTADLIAALAADTEAAPPRKLSPRLLGALAIGVAIAVCIVAFVYGIRPDLATAVTPTALKSGFGLVAALALAPIVMRLSRPNIEVSRSTFAVLAFTGACVIAALAHLVMAQSFAPLGLASGFPECLKRVPLLAIPIAAILFFVVRSFAPTRLTLAGAAIGALSGAVAIIPYALFCPMNSVAYVATWYLASIVLCAAVGAVVGGRALRWT